MFRHRKPLGQLCPVVAFGFIKLHLGQEDAFTQIGILQLYIPKVSPEEIASSQFAAAEIGRNHQGHGKIFAAQIRCFEVLANVVATLPFCFAYCFPC